jgi:hypothetical protein
MSDITSQLGEMLSFTSRQLNPHESMAAPSNPLKLSASDLLAENHSLRSTLEEEKYRRKVSTQSRTASYSDCQGNMVAL